MPAMILARRDPTRTLALRRRFRGQMRRRWREVMHLVRQALLDRDVFGRRLATQQGELPPERGFAQGPPDAQVNQFMRWLRTTLTQTVTQPRRWWERLVRQGYDAGQRRGQRDAGVAEAGAPLYRGTGQAPYRGTGQAYGTPQALRPQTPAWQNLLTLVEERLTQLAESTAVAVREAVTRTFTGTLSGLASAVTQALETVGLRRGDALTETSIVEAHATGTLDALEQAGVPGVTLDAEYVRFTTVGDERVCQRCRAREGLVYTIAEARSIIPLHPLCRCSWSAVSGVRARATRLAQRRRRARLGRGG